MRLLNTFTFELQEFVDHNIPEYAILSHRWEDEEITYQDVTNFYLTKEEVETKKGWFKLQRCCQQSTFDGHDWVWIDSCCIDKSSSAELSEAIYSMYRWYR